MSTRVARNNRIAGLFVIAATLGALVMLTLVGGGLERIGKKSVEATFTVESGAASLAPGSSVTLGGIKIGTVTAVRHAPDFKSINVRMSINRDIPLLADATPVLVPPILGGTGVINFDSLGSPDADPLQDGVALTGQSGGNPFLQGVDLSELLGNVNVASLMGDYTIHDFLGEPINDRDSLYSGAKQTLASFRDTSERVRSAVDNYDTFIGPNIAGATDNFIRLTEGPVNNAAQWNQNITNILANAEQGSQSFNERLETVRGMLYQAELVATPENAQRINDLIANADLTAADIAAFASSLSEGELSQAIDAFVTNGNEAVLHAESALANARFRSDEILADMALTAVQLRDTAIEVRRSPWRLVYRPNDDELNFELLYDAARMYATAVSDLRTTSAALEAAMRTDADRATPEDTARFEALIEEAERATQRYRTAEGTFIDLLQQAAGNTGAGE